MRIGDFFPILDQKPQQGQRSAAAERPADALDNLRLAVGQLIKAKVSEAETEGRLLLTMAGKTIPVRSEVPLKPGQDVWLEVRELKPQPRLSLATAKGAAHDFLRLLLADGSGIGRATGLLNSLGTAAEGGPLARLLTQFPLLENLLGSLQTGDADTLRLVNFLEALRRQTEKSPGPGTAAKQGGGQGLTGAQVGELTVGTQQTEKLLAQLGSLRGFLASAANVNTHSFNMDGLPFLLFPCFFSDNAGWGEWLFQRDETAKESDPASIPYRLAFFLSMSKIGDLQLDFSVSEDSVSGTLFVENSTVRGHIATALPELQVLLHNLGFTSINLSCAVFRTGMQQAIRERIGQSAGLGSTNLLDVTA